MKDMLKILLLEDCANDAEEIMRRLESNEKFNCECRLATGRETYLKALEEFGPSVILSDHSLPQFDSKEALVLARRRFPDIPFIMVTGTISEEYAIDMIKTGADDYILKDRMTRLPAAIMASVQKRKAEAEKKLLEQEREFDRNNLQALINNTNDLIWSIDRNFRLLISNDAFDRLVTALTGQTVEKGSSILPERFSQDQLSRFRDYYERAFAGEGFTVVEYADLPGGRWSEISFYPILKGDKVSGASCFSRDITHRKITEKEIADYKHAIDQASIVSITDETGTIKYVNDNFCKISGYAATDLLGRDHRMINSGYHPGKYMANLWATIAGGMTWAGELRNKAKDGSLYWVDVTIFPIMDHKRRPVQYLMLGTDITKRKTMEQEIMEQKIQEQRKIARAIIKTKDKERNLLGQELHDNVNQILAATRMMLSAALVDPERCAELIIASNKNIENALEENRKIARGLVVPDFETIPFTEQLNALTDNMLKKAGLHVIMDTTHLREELLDDEQKLAVYRAAQEQYTNIIKHAEAGFVYVLMQTTGDYFKMIIFDNGKGQDQGQAQGQSKGQGQAQGQGKGQAQGQATGPKTAGIGLRNIRARLGLFGGTARTEASPGKGFTLELIIPLNSDPTR